MSPARQARAWAKRLLVSPRKRRRLTLVGAMSPGVLIVALAPQVSRDPSWLGLGLLLSIGPLIGRRLFEPRLPAMEAQGSPVAGVEDQSNGL